MDPADLQPKFNRPVAEPYLFPEPDAVTAVQVAEVFATHPNIAYPELRVKSGDHIGLVNSHLARAGVVITTGESLEAALGFAHKVAAEIPIDFLQDAL